MADRPLAILIAGPTASGKSAAALELARLTGGAIVNADSMQVYSVLQVLTARPGPADLEAAEHRLFGHVHPLRPWSVAQWLEEATATLAELREQGRTAIFAGGTGLYFTALESGLSEIPAPDPAIREKWRRVAAQSPEDLHPALAALDPHGAGLLRPGDAQRLARALEVIESTGVPIWRHQAEGKRPGPLSGWRVERFVLEPSRAVLHDRINARFEAMMDGGATEEVRELLELDPDPALPVMKAIGVPQIAGYLSGAQTRSRAIELSQAATRQYAKRQSTWFRGQFPPIWRRMSGQCQILEEIFP